MPIDNPAGIPIVGPGSPYITPTILTAASTGVAWSTIGGPGINLTPAQQFAEQLNICVRATSAVDSAAHQPLRATVDTEQLTGPGDFRVQNQPTGVTRLMLSRNPILSVIGGQVANASTIPYSWQTIPANNFQVEVPPLGIYGTSAPSSADASGQSVLLAPGWITWGFGRQSGRIQITYINGWPHASLTQSAAAGATTLIVDDITGWAGAAGVLYDAGNQELVSCLTVTPAIAGALSGPGTLTLATGLAYAHVPGTLVTTLPATIMQAAIYFAVSMALTRGATSTTVQSIGGGGGGGSGPSTQEAYAKLARDMVAPFRRVV